MPSRTTLWRRKKSGGKLSSRGRHTAEERQERLNFVGAVAAQLLETGQASHRGLKKFVSKASLSDGFEFDPLEDLRPKWTKPSPAVWSEIESSPHNTDCLALAATYIGKLVAVRRHGSLRGDGVAQPEQHRDSRPRREALFKTHWQAIEGMTKQTAHYWKNRRKDDYENAISWLANLLKRHGLTNIPARAGATYFRDDIDYRLTAIVREANSVRPSSPLALVLRSRRSSAAGRQTTACPPAQSLRHRNSSGSCSVNFRLRRPRAQSPFPSPRDR